ncbi:MAG: GyrI-like domain-containing protein, partial [Planctomycetota bacterium]
HVVEIVGHPARQAPDRLLEPDVALEDAGSVPVGDDECPAVRARFGGGRPVTFAFDPETHRIRRVLFEMTDPQKGKRLPVVMDVSGWDEVEDIQVPHEVRMVWGEGDEVQMIEERYTDVQWNPPIADEVLAAPETAAPPEVSVKEVAETRVVEHTFVGPYQDVGDGIQAAMQWIGQNGGEVAGGVTLLYREPPNPEDFARSKTVIQVPVRMAGKTVPGEMRLLRRPAFQFAYAPYEGHASGCHLLMQAVLDWCKQNGYEPMPRRPMPYFRVTYLKMDPQTGQCTAEVGYPVGKRAE